MNKKSAILLLLIMTFFQSTGQNTFNLDPTIGLRFSVTDKVWPTHIGEGDVCMWSDDKLAAFTITIDDNNEQDIPFWKTMISKYGFHFTWFVITEANPAYNVQDWNLYNDLALLGSQVDGHDDRNWYNNPTGGETNPTDADYLARLQRTQTKIDTELTSGNNKCLTYAYPYGEGNEAEAKKVFIGARGTQGLLNQSNTVNYLNVNSVSNGHLYGNDTNRNKYILPLLDKVSTLYGTNYYRGWGSTHFHGLDALGETTTDEFLQYLANKPDLWVAGFSEVTQYSQSFATHNLTIDNVAAGAIKFTLTDEMLNSAFNFPLSVKIRIDNSWVNVSAIQNGIPVDAEVVLHNGNKYALVKAVPDLGQVTLAFQDILSVKDKNNQKLDIYPNPITNGELTVSLEGFEGNSTNLDIYSITGSLVYNEEIERNLNSNFIAHLNLSPGLYIVSLRDGLKSQTQKLIIQ